MKCYYKILELEQNASEDDIKKSYRKLALKWHPDKNRENEAEAKDQFQYIQQAYDVLSDPQERAWYDKHKDSILRGGPDTDYKDECLNIYPYFTTSCYKGFADDPNSFYSIYRDVFEKLASEDAEFCESDEEIPGFGNSKSSYDDIVHPFYSYWSSYSTKKTYSWLEKYDIKQAPNRRVGKLMEKDNKIIRDKAKKERNEEIKALVAFVRKRDKRVLEYIKLLEQKSIENEKKAQDLRRKQKQQRKEEIETYVECDWAKFSNLTGELEQIEANLASGSSDSEEIVTDFFCFPCNKGFKNEKSLSNHEKSKKHKENLLLYAEEFSSDIESESETKNPKTEESEQELEIKTKKKKKKQKKQKIQTDCEPENEEFNLYEDQSRRKNKKTETVESKKDTKKKTKKKDQRNGPATTESQKDVIETQDEPENQIKSCGVCKEEFASKNELFKHLRTSGHAIPLDDKTPVNQNLKKKSSKRN